MSAFAQIESHPNIYKKKSKCERCNKNKKLVKFKTSSKGWDSIFLCFSCKDYLNKVFNGN